MKVRHRVVMVTTSYPRFPGDTIGTFMEPIARGVAARGHEVHLVAPWHPLVRRPDEEAGVRFHFFRYAPLPGLNVFGYAGALRADVELRATAWAAAPFALIAGWRAARSVARRCAADLLHGHWVIPGGAIAAAAARRLPAVISLHGSDIYVAERHALARCAARAAFRRAAWITACSEDLRRRAIAMGAPADRAEVLPYGVDGERFRPDPSVRAERRAALRIGDDAPVVFAAGRFVRKKGFDYLIDAVARLAPAWPALRLLLAGDGDLQDELQRQVARLGLERHVRLVGILPQPDVARYLAAADVAVIPSIRDESGNVDGLPNVVMESLASGTPVVATTAGGIGAVAADGRTALLVPERDATALAGAIDRLLRDPQARARIGRAAREDALHRHGWGGVAERLESIYDRVTGAAP